MKRHNKNKESPYESSSRYPFSVLRRSGGIGLSSLLQAAEPVKIGFLVKQAEEPWFQTEWAFAEKASKDKGFTLIKIAVPDGEKTLSAIETALPPTAPRAS